MKKTLLLGLLWSIFVALAKAQSLEEVINTVSHQPLKPDNYKDAPFKTQILMDGQVPPKMWKIFIKDKLLTPKKNGEVWLTIPHCKEGKNAFTLTFKVLNPATGEWHSFEKELSFEILPLFLKELRQHPSEKNVRVGEEFLTRITYKKTNPNSGIEKCSLALGEKVIQPNEKGEYWLSFPTQTAGKQTFALNFSLINPLTQEVFKCVKIFEYIVHPKK